MEVVQRVGCRNAPGQKGWWRVKVVGAMRNGKGWGLGLVEAQLAGCIVAEMSDSDLLNPRG